MSQSIQTDSHFSVAIGRLVIICHDQEGLPCELSLQHAKDNDTPVALLGMVLEASERHWPKGRLCEAAEAWAKLFAPLPAELRALEVLRQ